MGSFRFLEKNRILARHVRRKADLQWRRFNWILFMPPALLNRTLSRLGETQRNRLDWLLQAALTAWRLFVKNELLLRAKL